MILFLYVGITRYGNVMDMCCCHGSNLKWLFEFGVRFYLVPGSRRSTFVSCSHLMSESRMPIVP